MDEGWKRGGKGTRARVEGGKKEMAARRERAFSGQKELWRIKLVTSYPRVTDHNRMWSLAAATTTHGSPGILRQ
jgi:hypothetical protein